MLAAVCLTVAVSAFFILGPPSMKGHAEDQMIWGELGPLEEAGWQLYRFRMHHDRLMAEPASMPLWNCGRGLTASVPTGSVSDLADEIAILFDGEDSFGADMDLMDEVFWTGGDENRAPIVDVTTFAAALMVYTGPDIGWIDPGSDMLWRVGGQTVDGEVKLWDELPSTSYRPVVGTRDLAVIKGWAGQPGSSSWSAGIGVATVEVTVISIGGPDVWAPFLGKRTSSPLAPLLPVRRILD